MSGTVRWAGPRGLHSMVMLVVMPVLLDSPSYDLLPGVSSGSGFVIFFTTDPTQD